MWPFSKKPKMSMEEYAATRPPAPCGEQKTHVYWKEIERTTCPACAAKAAQEEKRRDMERLAEEIAQRVVAKLKEA